MTLRDIRNKVEAAKALGRKKIEVEFDSDKALTKQMKEEGIWLEGFGSGKVLWEADKGNGVYTVRAAFSVFQVEKSLVLAGA